VSGYGKQTANHQRFEWQVMEVIWKEAPLTAGQIIERLSPTRWSEKTIKTFLNRLVNKKVLDYEKEQRSYCYYPLVTREEYSEAASESFLSKVYNGSLNMMVANFIKNEKLSLKEIEAIKALLEEKQRLVINFAK
jgi:BlaI family penicillinase repressor